MRPGKSSPGDEEGEILGGKMKGAERHRRRHEKKKHGLA